MELGRLGVWYFTDGMAAGEAAEFAQRIERLGFSVLWIPESIGRHPFVHASWLLAQTERLNLATGIASIYNRDAGTTIAGARTLAEQSGGRFILGLGVSHRPMVEGIRGHRYGKPVTTMQAYLRAMREAYYRAPAASEEPPILLAALGLNMLSLAASDADGAHPYFTTPEHTAIARETMGPDSWLCVEQKVILERDPARARELARQVAATYIGLTNYRNNWLRLGFDPSELEEGGSDRFIDATFAWGDETAIANRIRDHLDAGANHVCVQPVNPNGIAGDPHWPALELVSALDV